MQINRYNYEEYFLLYTDNELSAQERAAVEKFAAGQPDLQEELNQLLQYKIVPEKMVFPGKKNLIKEPGNRFIHTDNYEECFLLYADNELNEQQKIWVEEFIHNHPALQPAFNLINKAILTPDHSISFPEKEQLYRHEDNKVVPLAWWKLAAAAAVVLIAGVLWWNGQHIKIRQPIVQQHTVHQNQQSREEGQADELPNNIPSLINHDTLVLKQADPAVSTIQQRDHTPVAPVEKALIKRIEKPMRRSQPHTEDIVQPGHASSVALNTINPSTIDTREPIIDKPAVFSDPVGEGTGDSNISLASNNDTEDVYITSVHVNKKIPLRGLFRKASRFINKTTSNGGEKTILIGNIEVALK